MNKFNGVVGFCIINVGATNHHLKCKLKKKITKKSAKMQIWKFESEFQSIKEAFLI